MKTLTIKAPEGHVIDTFDKETGQVTFKPEPKDIKERIKKFSNVLAELNIIKQDFEASCIGLEPDEIAYRKIKMIAKVLNEGWQPNWDNSSEYKYYPWFDMRSSGSGGFSFSAYDYWYTHSVVGSRLCFKSKDLAIYAGKQFEAIYKEFLTTNNN